MTRLRKKYSSKFKKQVALDSIKELKTISEISAEYGVHPNQISNWKKQLIEGAEDIFKGKRQKAEAATDKTEAILYEEIGRLKVELDWLKKKSCL